MRRSRRTEIEERNGVPDSKALGNYSPICDTGNGAALCPARGRVARNVGWVERSETHRRRQHWWVTARSASPTLQEPEHAFRIAVADLRHVGGRQVERFHHLDGGADVAAA